ncbi:MAG: HisA/HisF-related TIM barrel protein [Candidatus Kapabacteria bacterium]|nr:HisA/HisF-related TIM barrel protein [Candidatus Kapabacteria bacterium]
MLIIPSFELENGICSWCIQGEPGTEELYENLQRRPDELIKLLRRENFKALHILDKDSLIHGKEIDFNLIRKITDAVDIPVELHADFKSSDDCKTAIEAGLYRLIISNEMLLNLNICKEIIKEFSASRICFAVIVKGDRLYYEKLASKTTPGELINDLVSTGAKRVLVGTFESVFEGSDFVVTDHPELFEVKHLRYTIYGGINSPQQLWEISRSNSLNIDSAIIGQAIFRNSFPCQKIWRMIEAELENEKKNDFE